MSGNARPVARALRIAAVVSIAATLIQVVIGLFQRHALTMIEMGAYQIASERLQMLAWIGAGVHSVVVIVLVIVAGRWARAPGWLGVAVRVGQILVGLSLVAELGLMAMWTGDIDTSAFEMLERIQTLGVCAHWSGLAALLAGTRAPLILRAGHALLTAGWISFIVWATSLDSGDVPRTFFIAAPVVLGVWWAAGLWLAAPASADLEPAPRRPSDDPIRVDAAEGLALLRSAVIARVALAVIGAVSLVVLRAAPGSAGAAAWIFALAQCGLAALFAHALGRYARLPDPAVERGHISIVLGCLAIGALLELYGALQISQLFGSLQRAQDGAFGGMASMRDMEGMQTRAIWVGRIASLVGIVAAVSLAMSLRKSALWVDDAASVGRASTLAIATILGSGTSVVLLAVAQSGAVKETPILLGLAAVALVIAIAVLVTWLRLLGDLSAALGAEPDTTDRGPDLSAR